MYLHSFSSYCGLSQPGRSQSTSSERWKPLRFPGTTFCTVFCQKLCSHDGNAGGGRQVTLRVRYIDWRVAEQHADLCPTLLEITAAPTSFSLSSYEPLHMRHDCTMEKRSCVLIIFRQTPLTPIPIPFGGKNGKYIDLK
jgi:hypothetical protein